jgi:hypothetical protein
MSARLDEAEEVGLMLTHQTLQLQRDDESLSPSISAPEL